MQKINHKKDNYKQSIYLQNFCTISLSQSPYNTNARLVFLLQQLQNIQNFLNKFPSRTSRPHEPGLLALQRIIFKICCSESHWKDVFVVSQEEWVKTNGFSIRHKEEKGRGLILCVCLERSHLFSMEKLCKKFVLYRCTSRVKNQVEFLVKMTSFVYLS